MRDLLTLGEMLAVHARLRPEKTGARDLERSMTFRVWDGRASRLANALIGLGLSKGDRIAVLAYNAVEWCEIYAACARAGLVAVPVNFRLIGDEVRYVLEDSGAGALIVQAALAGVVEDIRAVLPIADARVIHFGGPCPAGWQDYEGLIAAAADAAPGIAVDPGDPWTLMYTSGTTGRPKGVIRNHRAGALLSLVTEIELGLSARDDALLVMPMCHANSLYFFGSFSYCGATTTVYSRASFDSEHALATMAATGVTFTSLVPTHYIMMLAAKRPADLARISKLMISSAPARADTKRAVMEMFPNSGLFELYGSSECGWTTMLHPNEQFTHLGSVGRECVGSAPIRLLGEDGEEVPDGEVGELYQNTPYLFDGYWNLPEKTEEAFRGDWCTVGDMARRDEHGFIQLVDRKKNMIISGGENIYPSEVEGVLGTAPGVKDVAVIGVPDEKWGEAVHAVIVLHAGAETDAAAILDYARPKMAGYKRPRGVTFLTDDQMPRTATGKILHRELRAMIGAKMEKRS